MLIQNLFFLDLNAQLPLLYKTQLIFLLIQNSTTLLTLFVSSTRILVESIRFFVFNHAIQIMKTILIFFQSRHISSFIIQVRSANLMMFSNSEQSYSHLVHDPRDKPSIFHHHDVISCFLSVLSICQAEKFSFYF